MPFKRLTVCAALAAVCGPLFSQSTTDNGLAGFRVAQSLASPTFDPSSLADVFGAHRLQLIQYLRAKPAHKTLVRDAAFQATFRDVLQAVEDARVDEQTGSSSSSAGSTSAAERPGISDLLTAAIEAGAMTQTLDQNVLTLRANVEGLYRFVTGQEIIPQCVSPTDTACNGSALNNLELAASFNVSSSSNTASVSGQEPASGAQATELLSVNRRNFASATARYVIVNSRDLKSKKYRDAWLAWFNANAATIGPAAADLLKAFDDIINVVANTPAKGPDGNPVTRTITVNGQSSTSPVMVYDQWLVTTRADLKAAARTTDAIETVLKQRLDVLETSMRTLIPDLDTKLELAGNAYMRYFNLTRQGYELGNMPMLTASFTYAEPSAQPKLLISKIAFAWSPKGKGTVNPGTVTLNGGVSMYTKVQPTDTAGKTSRWRSADFALQFDRPMGGTSAPAAITLGSYIQYQVSPGLIDIPAGSVTPTGNVPLPGNATVLLAPKGTIAVAHASITLHIPKSGIRIPIGISWSNRTELVKGSEVRGHIGFNIDTDSLALAK